jgi:hypothetical protein
LRAALKIVAAVKLLRGRKHPQFAVARGRGRSLFLPFPVTLLSIHRKLPQNFKAALDPKAACGCDFKPFVGRADR